MATSGTTAFDLNIDDIIEEAYERCGIRTNSGFDLRSARRSLNLLFSEWGNRGVHLFKVEQQTQALTAGTDANTFTHLKYFSINRIEDAGAYTNQADVAYRFLPCMCSGLAYYLAMKKAPDKIQTLRLIYEDELQRALTEDGQRTSVYISPQTYFGDGVG
jgi:hypothetical protein